MENTSSHKPYYKPTHKFSDSFLLFCIQKKTWAATYTETMNRGSNKINETGNLAYKLVEMVALEFGDRTFLLHNNFSMTLSEQLTIINLLENSLSHLWRKEHHTLSLLMIQLIFY